jgi:FkbM family methyltransferase
MLKEVGTELRKTWLYSLYRRLFQTRSEASHISSLQSWSHTDEAMADFYRQFISPGDLVFDVGANQGSRTKVFSRLGARVVAFEPQPRCYERLKGLFKGVETVRVVNQALGAAEGVAEMYVSEANVLSTLSSDWISVVKRSGRFNGVAWNKTERVSITTLDSAMRQFGRPSFIKIDVEGYEYEVLSGLSTPIETVSIEFISERIQETYKCLDKMGLLSRFEAQLSFGESMTFAKPSWLSSQGIKEALGATGVGAWGDVYIRSLGANCRNAQADAS